MRGMKKYKIGIDIRYLSNDILNRGICEYIRNLVNGFDENISDNFIFSFYAVQNNETINLFKDNVSVKYVKMLPLPKRYYAIWSKSSFRSTVLKDKLDIVHFTEFKGFLPNINSIKLVTIYDLIPLLFKKHYFTLKHIDFYPYFLYKLKSIKNADAIITISETSKKDIVDYLGIAPSKIFITPLAPKDCFRPINKNSNHSILNKLKLNDSRYFIYVGGFDFRKNILFLLRQFDLARDKMDAKLVLVGILQGVEKKIVYNYMKTIKHKEDIVFADYVDDKDLLILLNHSTALVFPSLYEGFGLPIVEAINCKIPVLAYASSAAKEILGNSSGLFYCFEDNELANLMQKIILDNIFAKELLECQFPLENRYSWKNTVKATLDVYKKVLI
jgi:glycosyltransferase involved in cell wall biosynthesis